VASGEELPDVDQTKLVNALCRFVEVAEAG
jgi:hypothetical protein